MACQGSYGTFRAVLVAGLQLLGPDTACNSMMVASPHGISATAGLYQGWRQGMAGWCCVLVASVYSGRSWLLQTWVLQRPQLVPLCLCKAWVCVFHVRHTYAANTLFQFYCSRYKYSAVRVVWLVRDLPCAVLNRSSCAVGRRVWITGCVPLDSSLPAALHTLCISPVNGVEMLQLSEYEQVHATIHVR